MQFWPPTFDVPFASSGQERRHIVADLLVGSECGRQQADRVGQCRKPGRDGGKQEGRQHPVAYPFYIALDNERHDVHGRGENGDIPDLAY